MLMGVCDVSAGGRGLGISSPAFAPSGSIPQVYTCDGKDISPELVIRDVPRKAKSLVLIVEDPDAPAGVWTHWLLWNIRPGADTIKQGTTPTGAVDGTNDFGEPGYGGPCPPWGTHRYFFKLYALDAVLHISRGSRKPVLERAMKGHVIAHAELIGRYTRK